MYSVIIYELEKTWILVFFIYNFYVWLIIKIVKHVNMYFHVEYNEMENNISIID